VELLAIHHRTLVQLLLAVSLSEQAMALRSADLRARLEPRRVVREKFAPVATFARC
jgi:hypothetical protein